MNKRELYKTDIEEIMFNALTDSGIEFSREHPIRCKYGYILDFAISDKKICIECDGEPWHPKGNLRDKRRDDVLRKMGWKVLRFRGNKIRNDIDACLKIIKQEIK